MQKIFYNANIVTFDKTQPTANAFLTNDESIVFVGSNDDVMALKTDDTLLFDMQGKTILPSFYDTGASIYKMIEERLKNAKLDEFLENNDEIDYGINQIEEKAQILSNKGIRTFNKYGQKSVIKTKNNIEFAKNRIKKKIENNKIIKTKENITNARKTILKVENKTRKAIKDTPKRIK